MYGTYSAPALPSGKRPIGVWILTIHAAIFAGLLPLLVKLWLLSDGQFNGEDVALFVLAIATNIAILPLAYATWQGSAGARWMFLGAFALHYGLDIWINLDAAQLPLLDPDVAQRFQLIAVRSALWIPIVIGYFLLPRTHAWFAAMEAAGPAQRRSGERGSNVAQAAGVAMFAAILIGAILLGGRELSPGVDRAISCLNAALSGGGATCGGQTAATTNAAPSDQRPAPQEQEDDDDGGFWGGVLDGVQIGLDVVGLVPGVGEIADGANALISLGRGNYADAALSAGSMIPFLGWGSTAAKWGKRGVDAVNAADAANDGRRVADRADDAADAANRGDEFIPPCAIGAAPTGKIAGLAKPLARCDLNADGSFVDDSLEEAYQDYLSRKQSTGDTPRSREDWLERREFYDTLERGNDFNRTRADDYPYNEVHLENGKRLDSYDPDTGEIVSRKATDFDNIQESTFRSYLQELRDKYPPGTQIRSNKYPDIDGDTLDGRMILEVPDSNMNSQQRARFEEIAREYGIDIRYAPEG